MTKLFSWKKYKTERDIETAAQFLKGVMVGAVGLFAIMALIQVGWNLIK